MRAYRRAMSAAGVIAGLITVAYVVAVAVAAADGGRGIEVPARLAGVMLSAIVVLTVLSSAAWIADHSNRIATEAYIRPIVRNELEHARTEWCRTIADDVAARLNSLQDHDARRVAKSVATITIAGVREAVADEVEDRMQEVLAAGRRYGALMEATSNKYSRTGTDHGVGNTPRAPARGTLHHLRQPNTDDN